MKTEQKPIQSGYSEHSTAYEIISGIDVTGNVIVITGGHSGLGLEAAKVFSGAGATVVVGARDVEKATRNLSGLPNVEFFSLDLAEPVSVDEFAEKVLNHYPRIDILINNAGVMRLPTLMRNSLGYELQFATNHLGHFRLTSRLWSALKQAGNARVVNVSSVGHRYCGVNLEDPNYTNRRYNNGEAYGQSKSANILFTVELDRRGAPDGIRAFAVHPGSILTDLARHLTDEELASFGIMKHEQGELKAPTVGFKNLQQGAATTVWCAVSPLLNKKGGVYCENGDIAEVVKNDSKALTGVRIWAIDAAIAKDLWDLSERLLA